MKITCILIFEVIRKVENHCLDDSEGRPQSFSDFVKVRGLSEGYSKIGKICILKSSRKEKEGLRTQTRNHFPKLRKTFCNHHQNLKKKKKKGNPLSIYSIEGTKGLLNQE